MESWRERGFVPDSDDEDAFDSQEKGPNLNTRDEDAGSGLGVGGTEEGFQTSRNANGNAADELNDERRNDTRDNDLRVEEGLRDGIRDNVAVVVSEDIGLPLVDERERPPTSDGEESGTDQSNLLQVEKEPPVSQQPNGDISVSDDELDLPLPNSQPRFTPDIRRDETGLRDPVDDGDLATRKEKIPTTKAHDDPFSTPRAKQQRDYWDIPSSSPDLLQLDHHPWRKQTSPASTPTPKAQEASQLRPADENVESSPLSSLSSVRSSILGRDDQHRPEEPPNQSFEDLLPPLDIPEDILRELEEPTRRSLRQRNPIQLHPYLLEDAKYQTLMKARGIKPVRIAQQLRQAALAADESQGSNLGEDAGSSSDTQMTGLNPPSSSPLDLRQISEINPIDDTRDYGRRHHGRPPRSPGNTTEPRSSKRRRVSGPGDHRQRQNLEQVSRPARPQVVINNVSTSVAPDASIFDIPSPPRSGSVSSPPVPVRTKFRFPRGFEPPNITPRTESRKSTQDVDNEAIFIDDNEVGGHREAIDSPTVRSESPRSDSNSDDDGIAEQDDTDEAAVRRYQRKIKGVLPASWLRLDQQKQKGIPNATQRNNDRIARLEAERAKGVAKRVTKKKNSSAPSNARDHLSSLRHLAEESEEEGEANDSDKGEGAEPLRSPASFLGLDDSLIDLDPDGDILEDNRIDYMFPTMSRNAGQQSGRKHAKKRRRPKENEARTGSQPKKLRLKRQARLTDAVYGGKRERRPRSSESLPRLGILDAPDVSAKPRKEQPQFLRVAARKARSRQDKGRRSPSRKVIRLSSRMDTEDANDSLREWCSGRLRQTALPRAASQTPRRQPLRDRSMSARNVFKNLTAKRTGGSGGLQTRQVTPARSNNAVNENIPVVNAPAASTPSDTRTDVRNTATRPVQQRRGNAWVVQRNIAITSLSRRQPRPVVPEIESHDSTTTASSSIQGTLALLGRDDRLPLNRFLSADTAPNNISQATTEPEKTKPVLPKPTAASRRRQLKKRQPNRLDTTHIEDYALPVTFSPGPESAVPQIKGQSHPNKTGGRLNSFRTAYSVDFGVSPLRLGVFFHESTFIGSGEFYRSLDIVKRDLDKSDSRFQFNIGDQTFLWGAWDDSVSSQLGTIFDNMLETAGTAYSDGGPENRSRDLLDPGCTAYRSLLKYVSEGLSFVDPIDRTGFVTRAIDLASKLMEELSTLTSTAGNNTEQLVRAASYSVVFANQICQVACHSLVGQSIQDEALGFAKSTSKQAVGLISSSKGQAAIQQFLAATRQQDLCEAGIKNDHPVAEAYVIVQHVLRSADRFKGCLDDILTDAYTLKDAENTVEQDIGGLESAWQQLFTTLPLQEVDALGIARVGSRFQRGHDNWGLVRRLLRPVFDRNEASSESQPISHYSYCRVLYSRCFILINHWGWRDCKPILDTLYDFFAKRTLYNLRLEESFKSPAFLDELDGSPSFQVVPGDPCFHILLKTIATGLRFLSQRHDKKKIRNYTWRLLPNHGRDYPKEQSIRQADLDALRNHHDLLCTLYSSVPDGCRFRLETIRNLVHPASSHREICKISLRTWARLARFKLSTSEEISGLEPFAEWHAYFVTEFLKQHGFARKEIEAQNEGGKQFSQQLIDSTVAQNQRQIESLLKMALQGMQSAIKTAPTLEHAQKIVSQTPIKSILDLFDSRTARLNATVIEGLQVIIMYVQKVSLTSTETSMKVANAPVSADEDSQDYGDWADIEAAYGYEPSPITPGVEHVEKVFHPAVSRLVSNCFGEDRCPDDAILLNVVDCWTSIAHTLVRHGLRRWDSYLSPYEGDSWVALRWTMQTRKFTPQFLAECIEKDGEVLSECKVQILGMWLSSLVERISMLKFQHCFTEAILNRDAEDPLLRNLPFTRDSKEGRYSITVLDFRQRRLSLISSLLANMRAHVQRLDDVRSQEYSTTKQDYREIIQKTMSSMKSNYQELGNGNAEVRGDYVTFVHNIVGFLQQHTRDICPIDPFFTDPATFPPPANDPTYIVARLKGYEPKLSSSNVVKTLIIFIQGVSERAALDGTQTFLVNQLYDSMKETYEGGNPDRPTLQAALMQSVFPAYLATAFDNPAAWILSRPIIQTLSRVFKELCFNIDTTDARCFVSVLNIFSAVFVSSYEALHRIVINTSMLTQPTVLKITTAFFEMISSTLLVVDYLDRLTTDSESNQGRSLISHVRAFQQLAIFAISSLQNRGQQMDLPLTVPILSENSSTYPNRDISAAATRELQAYINESWSYHQTKYYFTRRGQPPHEVQIEASVAAEIEHYPEKGLIDAASEFLNTLDSLDLFGEGQSEDMNGRLRIQTVSENFPGLDEDVLLL
ncbi:Mus7/MMS22 family-domain-containing protein [Aspergillus unguis]